MAFEIVKKNSAGTCGIQEDEVSIGKGSVSFGNKLGDMLREKGIFCEVYLDAKESKIGFRPTRDNVTGFAVSRNKESKISISGGWVKRIQKGRYDAKVEDGMIIIEGCSILSKKEYTEMENKAKSEIPTL